MSFRFETDGKRHACKVLFLNIEINQKYGSFPISHLETNQAIFSDTESEL